MGKIFQGLLLLFLLIGLILITPLVRPVEAQIHAEECAPTYAVRGGDTFQIIAQRCGVSEAELRGANPHISEPNLIFPGQVLVIPGILPITAPESIPETAFITVTALQTSQLLISPLSGPAGTQIIVTGSGFQPNQVLHVGPAQFGQQPVQLYAVTTNANGAFRANLQIPFEAMPNQTWVILANDPQTGATNSSGAFTITPPAGDPNVIQPESDFQIPATGSDTNWPVHVVSRGETLFRIAQRYGTSVSAILQINPHIVNPNLIFPGQTVRIPVAAPIPPTAGGAPIPSTGGTTYVVRSGDTLSRIAAQFGTTVPTLLQLNPQIVNPNILEAGTVIRVG